MNTTAKNVFLWIVIVVAVVVLWNFLNSFKTGNIEELKYSQFNQMLENGQIPFGLKGAAGMLHSSLMMTAKFISNGLSTNILGVFIKRNF